MPRKSDTSHAPAAKPGPLLLKGRHRPYEIALKHLGTRPAPQRAPVGVGSIGREVNMLDFEDIYRQLDDCAAPYPTAAVQMLRDHQAEPAPALRHVLREVSLRPHDFAKRNVHTHAAALLAEWRDAEAHPAGIGVEAGAGFGAVASGGTEGRGQRALPVGQRAQVQEVLRQMTGGDTETPRAKTHGLDDGRRASGAQLSLAGTVER